MSVQRCVIEDWLPDQLANGQHGHWSVKRKKLQAAQTMAWASCKYAGWTPVEGKAQLTVTLVFGINRRRDTDNLHSRVKGLIDGIVKGGWIADDDTEHLDLIVRSEVQPGRKATILELAAGQPNAGEVISSGDATVAQDPAGRHSPPHLSPEDQPR